MLLDTFFPANAITKNSSDPCFVTPGIKYYLRKKNRLMHSGHLHEADKITMKIRQMIINNNINTFVDCDTHKQSATAWSKINSFLHSIHTTHKSSSSQQAHSKLTANDFNAYYSRISQDNDYETPEIKSLTDLNRNCIMTLSVYDVLTSLWQIKRTTSGWDQIPFWFITLSAEYISIPVTTLFNCSLLYAHYPNIFKKSII